MYVGYLFCVRFDVPMHEAIAAFSRQINVLYYFVLCFCFSVSRRQHEDNQTSGEIGVSVCISSALYGPPTTLRLSPFSCILVALGNSLLHSNFLFSVRAEKFCRCTPMQRWFANFSRCACIYILPRAREYWRSRDFGTKEHLCAHRSFTRIIDSSSEAE